LGLSVFLFLFFDDDLLVLTGKRKKNKQQHAWDRPGEAALLKQAALAECSGAYDERIAELEGALAASDGARRKHGRFFFFCFFFNFFV
jgi:hypothetical protein